MFRRDELVDLADLWGRDETVPCERLLEAETTEERLAVVESALLERFTPVRERDPAVVSSLCALDGGARVGG